MDEKEANSDVAVRGSARRRRVYRSLRIGCVALLAGSCGLLSLLVVALQSGPVNLGLPGDNVLKIGSDSVVLSNYSFQNGTTYFVDLNGNGVRNILQVNYLSDTRDIELVLHYASKEEQGEHHLLRLCTQNCR